MCFHFCHFLTCIPLCRRKLGIPGQSPSDLHCEASIHGRLAESYNTVTCLDSCLPYCTWGQEKAVVLNWDSIWKWHTLQLALEQDHREVPKRKEWDRRRGEWPWQPTCYKHWSFWFSNYCQGFIRSELSAHLRKVIQSFINHKRQVVDKALISLPFLANWIVNRWSGFHAV